MYTRFNLHIADYIAEVIINRADKANALDRVAWDEMRTIFTDLSQRNDVRVVILRGEGKHFCSGIDISLLGGIQQQIQGISPDEGRRREQLRRLVLDLQACVNAIEACDKPVLTAIHGGCIGGGVDIACAADMRYCTESTVFCIREIDMGMVADLGTLQRMPKLIAPGIVAELAYTGRHMSGTEAAANGFVNRCFASAEEMLAGVRETARQIAAKSPLGIRGTKEMLRYTRDHSTADALNYIATWNAAMLLSADLQEAMMAQMQKRQPSFE
jgi:enoyl-CoA hydratase